MYKNYFNQLFLVDNLSLIMIALVCFVGVTVGSFSLRYLKGDSKYKQFFVLLALVVLSTCIMVSSNNFIMLLASLGLSNWFLVRLMIHKSAWVQAKASGALARNNFLLGFVFLASSFALFYFTTGEITVSALIKSHPSSVGLTPLILLLLASMAQSAIWPFHKWLVSSLNSPTPVSALMHAGLINGGGFLLTRFAPLYVQKPHFLTVIFIVGVFTALIGTLWKLMQSDIKRMLACSTMGQMGFMIAQCGLGLFPAAVTHLCFHGLFKSYLFLSSGGAAQSKKLDLSDPPKIAVVILALICGCIGCSAFALITGKIMFLGSTNLVLCFIVLIAATQLAITVLSANPYKHFVGCLILTTVLGFVYGLNVHFLENFLAPMDLMQPQPLNGIHFAALLAFAGAWMAVLFAKKAGSHARGNKRLLALYVRALNASQPHSKTVTCYRKQYKYEA